MKTTDYFHERWKVLEGPVVSNETFFCIMAAVIGGLLFFFVGVATALYVYFGSLPPHK